MQMRELDLVLEKMNERHIHTAVETSLFTTDEYLSIAIKHIDLLYVDIKIMDTELCKTVLEMCIRDRSKTELALSRMST